MIKGKRKIILTADAILEKISTYDIYRFYQGPFKINRVAVNKWRAEEDPSLITKTLEIIAGEVTLSILYNKYIIVIFQQL